VVENPGFCHHLGHYRTRADDENETIMKSLFLVSFVFLSLITMNAFPQLSGSYTIGDTTCDFTTIQQAIDSLSSAGTSGNVSFLVKPGHYQSFYMTDLHPTNTGDTITFSKWTIAPDAATFRGEIRIGNSTGIVFKNLHFEPFSGQSTTCVGVSGSNSLIFDSCTFNNPFNNCFTTMEALFSVAFPFSGSDGSVLVKNGLLSSPEYTIYASGKKGTLTLLNNIINGTINLFNSGFQMNYTGNVLNLTQTSLQFIGQTFCGNTINAASLRMQGDFYNNAFYCGADLYAGKVMNNHFFSTFKMVHSAARISHNIFEQSFSLTFSYGSVIDGNRFLGDALFTGGQNTIHGNLFFGLADCSTGPGFILKHNNFHPDALLFMWENLSAVIENNNIGNLNVRAPQAVSMKNNNFIPHENSMVNVTGSNPFFYDPGYCSLQDLHATNPALTRKSTRLLLSIPGIMYDTDSVLRKTYPTIGANEVCCDFQVDTIDLLCDSLCLDLCTAPDSGFYWSPGNLFSDSLALSPVIHPKNPVMIYLNQMDKTIIDSVFVAPEFNLPKADGVAYVEDLRVHFINASSCFDSILWDFGDGSYSREPEVYHLYKKYGIYQAKLHAYNHLGHDSLTFPLLLTCLPGETTLLCGDSVSLNSCIDDFTGFYWSPGYLFRDSSEANPVIRPEDHDWVFLHHTSIPGVDYMHLFVYPNYPVTAVAYTVDSLTVHFAGTAHCADSVRWDFGDGASSTVQNPEHTYPSPGSYEGHLYGFSLPGSDTTHFTIQLTEIDDPEPAIFRIWPNPAEDFLWIESLANEAVILVRILNLTGQTVIEARDLGSQATISLSALQPRIYFVEVQTRTKLLKKKFIKR
jgi:PKD repeat protein